MGWKCRWQVTCDQCCSRGPLADDSRQAEAKAVKAGWLAWEGFYGRFHACAACKGRLDPTLGLPQSLEDSNEVRGER